MTAHRPASVVALESLNVSIVRAALERAGLPADTDLPTAPRAYLDAYAAVMCERRKEVFAAIEAAGKDAAGMSRHFVDGMAAAYARATAPRVATDGAGYQNTAQETVVTVERPRPAPFAHAPYVEKLRFYQGLHAERLRPIPAADAASDYAAAVDFHAGEPAGLYPDPVTMTRNATAFRRGELLARCRKARAMMRGDAWQGDGPAMELAAAQAALWENRDERRAFIEAAARAAGDAPVVEPVASVVGEAGSRFQLAADAHPSFPIRAGVIEATDAPQLPGDGATVRVRFDGEPEPRFVRPADVGPETDAPAYLAIQCQREGQPRGTFLYQGDNWRTGRLVSPVFTDSVELYQWAPANGWSEAPYDSAHPVGVYLRRPPGAPTMVPQPCQQQQARARGRTPQPARGERRYVTVRDTETGDVHRVLTSVARVGVAVVIFTPSNRHRQGELGGMLITHDDIRKAWVFNDEAEARRMLSRNGAPGERVIRAELVSDPAVA